MVNPIKTDSLFGPHSSRWLDFFYGHAELAATMSKDPTRVGAALVDPIDKICLMTGYNGPPRGVRDLPKRLQRPTKYLFASHAEANLIAFAARRGIGTDGCVVYVTHQPCAGCARTLIQAGIRAVFYGPGTTFMPQDEFDAATAMFREAHVLLERVK